MAIVDLLKELEVHFETFQVEDEGEYFETGDKSRLRGHVERCFHILDELLADSDKYYGPVRLADGCIVDLMERK